jgi:hypothetical protein
MALKCWRYLRYMSLSIWPDSVAVYKQCGGPCLIKLSPPGIDLVKVTIVGRKSPPAEIHMVRVRCSFVVICHWYGVRIPFMAITF